MNKKVTGVRCQVSGKQVPGARLQVPAKQVPGTRCQVSEERPKCSAPSYNLQPITYNLKPRTYNLEPRIYNLEPKTYNLHAGFTLVETLVAISLLTIAIVAPMSLTTQSLSSSYYARDQITAFHLAQEAIESIRHARDNNVLKNALGILTDGRQTDLLEDIPKNTDFIVDTTNDDDMDSDACDNGCPVLRKSSDGLYGYGSNWTPTQFTRTVRATFVPVAETPSDEIKLTVTVSWQTGSFRTRSFTISDNLYRWVNDGSAER